MKNANLFAFSSTSAENLNFLISQGSVAQHAQGEVGSVVFYRKFHTLSSSAKILKIS